MKHLSTLLICIIIAAGIGTNAQTIVNHTIGSCQYSGLKSTTSDNCPAGTHFSYANGTLSIYGVIEANCCGTHQAQVTQTDNTITINTFDTGELCNCVCNYCFKIEVSTPSADNIVVLNGTTFYTKDLVEQLPQTPADKLIDVETDLVNRLVTIHFNDMANAAKEVTLRDICGLVQKNVKSQGEPSLQLNLSNIGRGIYFVTVKTTTLKLVTQKILIK